MEKKKQHLVPRSYLEAWCDPATPEGQTPYLWAFDKDGAAVKRKSPKKTFTETDPYTFTGPEGKRDLRLEDGLSGVESRFAKLRREKIEKEEPLDEGDRATLLMFAAAMLNRTASQREHQAEQWGAVLDMGEKVEQAAALGLIPPELAPHDGPSLTLNEVRHIVAQPLQQTLGPFTDATYQVFKTLDMALLKATTEPGFITSDAPCVVVAPELDERPPTILDSVLHLPSTEVYLPLSPRFCLLLSRSGFTGSHEVPAAVVDDINRRIRFSCHRQFVVNQNLKRDYWFAEVPRDFGVG
jgi:hypothetical protein